MPALFLFLFKVNVALVLFCLGYYAVLRHLTFYTLNRIYLVIAILFSTLYPNINLSGFVERHQNLAQPVELINNWKTPAENLVKPLYQPNYWLWVEVVFWAGVALFAVRLLMQLFSLYKLYRQSKPGHVHDYPVRLIRDDISPFSFWRSIYINPAKLSPAELKSVLEHEQVHVSEWHTVDILLAELSTIFYWFNPGVWLMKKAVRENVEFITDRRILQKGTDSKEYQYSLVSVSLGATSNTIVNHFNMSTIKKRIIMMNTKRSSGYKLTRYVFLIPAVVVLLLVFSFSKAAITKKSLHNSIKSLAFNIKRVVTLNNDLPHIAIAKEKPVKATKPAPKMLTAKTSDTVYYGKSKDGKKSFFITADLKNDSITYLINGKKVSKQELSALDPAKTMSMELVEAERAKEFYPEAKDGSNRYVLFVTTDDSEEGKKLKERMDKEMGRPNLARVKNLTLHTHTTDGETSNSYSVGTGNSSSSSSSYSISSTTSSDDEPLVIAGTVSKNTSGTVVISGYQNKPFKPYSITIRGKGDTLSNDGVGTQAYTVEPFNEVRVVGKPKIVYLSKADNKITDKITIDNLSTKLIIVDGKEVKDLKKVSMTDIKSMQIINGKASTDQYGDKGKDGTIIITTKNKDKN